jgi:hypothetical protein
MRISRTEVFVVLGIVAVLAGIIFDSIHRQEMKQAGYREVCHDKCFMMQNNGGVSFAQSYDCNCEWVRP